MPTHEWMNTYGARRYQSGPPSEQVLRLRIFLHRIRQKFPHIDCEGLEAIRRIYVRVEARRARHAA